MPSSGLMSVKHLMLKCNDTQKIVETLRGTSTLRRVFSNRKFTERFEQSQHTKAEALGQLVCMATVCKVTCSFHFKVVTTQIYSIVEHCVLQVATVLYWKYKMWFTSI